MDKVQAMTQWGIREGLLKPGESATGGLLAQRAKDAGRFDAHQTYRAQLDNPNYSATNGGVQSAFIEPLTGYEKAGLSELAAGVDYSGIQQAMQGLQGALPQNAAAMSSLVSQGTQPITMADIARYQNPYQQMVIDEADKGLKRQADIARSRLNASLGGSRSFGDSSSAIQMSELARNEMELGNQQRAALLNQGFSTALGAAQQGQQNQLAGASLYNQGTGALTSGYSTLGNLAGQFASGQLANIQGKIGAGTAIRGFNQGMLDAAQAEWNRKQGFAGAQIDAFGNRLNAIQGGSTLQNISTPNTLSQLGAAGTAASGFLQQNANPFPWQAAGSVKPGGGTYMGYFGF